MAHLDRERLAQVALRSSRALRDRVGALRRRHQPRVREWGGELTLTVLLVKAAAIALQSHPRFNASLDAAAGELVLKRYYHVGVAVDTEHGLMVPVVRDVDKKRVRDLAVELPKLAARTRDGKASLDDLRGGTFTVTNTGALGGTGTVTVTVFFISFVRV